MRALAATMTAAILLGPSPAAARDPDTWLGRDKAAHFAASTGVAAIAYSASRLFLDARGHSLLFGGGLSLAIGAGKELVDLAGYGDPSWKDFAWDVIGTVAGLALAWSADIALGGVDRDRPAFAAPPSNAPLRAVAVTF